MPSAYLEHPELQEFFEITESDNHLLIRRGSLAQPCLVFHVPFVTPGKALAQVERLAQAWQDKGFARRQASEPIIEGSHVHSVVALDIEQDSLHAQIFDLGGGVRLREGGRKRIYHLRDGLHVQGDFDFEVFADMALGFGVIIDGDVRVTGVLSQLTHTYPSPILIFGNVFAHSFAHRDSHLAIEGNLTVDNIVYGEYNDGSMYVNGEVRGRAFISQDHDMDAAKLLLPVFDDDNGYEGLDASLLDQEDGLDTDAVRDCLWSGKSPLAKGFSYEPPVAQVPKLQPVVTSALTTQIRELAAKDDAEGIVDALENWPANNAPTEEWLLFIGSRLIAPSSTPGQKERLHRLRFGPAAEQARAAVVQVQTFEASAQDVKKLVNAMTGAGGGKRAEKLYAEDPPTELSLLRHSEVLMANVLLWNKDFPGKYLGMLERLLKDGVHVDGTVSLVSSQADVAALIKQHRPAVKLGSNAAT